VSRRVLLAALGVVLAVAATYVTWGRDEGDVPRARSIDVVFDSARGVSPGSAVKIAGARVGRVDEVALRPDHRALLTLAIDRRIGPLHRDATCGIRPEGLIGESFVSCDPGHRSAGVPRRGRSGRPELPVGRTSRPVNLADLLNLWSLPTGERTRVLLTQMGLGVAGRGDELRAIVERAHPTLRATRRVLAVVDGQRAALRRTLEQTARVARVAATRRDDLGRLAVAGDALTARVGRHDADLRASLRALPGLLTRARPALAQLDALGEQASPLLQAAERSAPGLRRLAADAGPVVRRATRTLDEVAPTLRRTRASVAGLAPLLPTATAALAEADPGIRQSDRALAALRDGGFFEGFWGFLYYAASALSRYDANGHLFAGLIMLNRCTVVTPVPLPGCSGWLRDEAAAKAGDPAAARAIGGPRR
jgi:virulence factor Mce-like protein